MNANEILNIVSQWVSYPLIILLLAVGVFLTISLRGLQFRTLGPSLYLAFIKRRDGDGKVKQGISHFQALMTALAATVGVGNIAGVAVAIAAGGPGAVFWMWMTGLLGMATKYSEAVLAMQYRIQDKDEFKGGPMYYIEQGLKNKPLALTFALFAAIAAFGTGNMSQSNTVATALEQHFQVSTHVSGLIMAGLTLIVIVGGVRSIARLTSVLVPVMILMYCSAAVYVLAVHVGEILPILGMILSDAFQPKAAVGGFAGASVMMVIRQGVVRGLFSNESGLGSAPIAAAAAQSDHPVRQAMVSMTQTFIDTIVVCSMTAIVILLNPSWHSSGKGVEITIASFGATMGMETSALMVTIAVVFFAYSTILGWSYYGERCVEYIAGKKSITAYRVVFSLMVYLGAVRELKEVFAFTDIMNCLMAFPNLLALIMLSPVIIRLTREYFTSKSA